MCASISIMSYINMEASPRYIHLLIKGGDKCNAVNNDLNVPTSIWREVITGYVFCGAWRRLKLFSETPGKKLHLHRGTWKKHFPVFSILMQLMVTQSYFRSNFLNSFRYYLNISSSILTAKRAAIAYLYYTILLFSHFTRFLLICLVLKVRCSMHLHFALLGYAALQILNL